MSRFFASSIRDDSSESENEENEFLSSSSDEENDYNLKKKTHSILESSETDASQSTASRLDKYKKKPVSVSSAASKYLKNLSDSDDESSSSSLSSDEDAENRKKAGVLSAKDKAYFELGVIVKSIYKAIKLVSFSIILKEFDNLNSRLHKSSKFFTVLPYNVAGALISVEAKLSEYDEDKKKTDLTTLEFRAFNNLKVKLKKFISSHVSVFEAVKANPELGALTESLSNDTLTNVSSSESDDESSSSDGELKKRGIDRWKKKKPSLNAIIPELSLGKKGLASTVQKPKNAINDESLQEMKSAVDKSDSIDAMELARERTKAMLESLTIEMVDKKLQEIHSTRGKRNVDRSEQILILRRLLELSQEHKDNEKTVSVLLVLISSQLDSVSTVLNYDSTSFSNWKIIEKDFFHLFDVLNANQHIIVIESVEENSTSIEDGKSKVIKLNGSISSLIRRLDHEHTRAFPSFGSTNSTLYQEVLAAECGLYKLLVLSSSYFDRISAPKEMIATILCKRLEKVYYKPTHIVALIDPLVRTGEISLETLVTSLVSAIYKYCENDSSRKLRIKALIYHVTYFCLNDEFNKARDLLVLSRLADIVASSSDVGCQILYNRLLAQLGLAAFRIGAMKESLSCLSELIFCGKAKELLGQGISISSSSVRAGSVPILEQEKLERSRMLPPHMWMNIEAIEIAYLICSLFISVPTSYLSNLDSKKRGMSKFLRRLLDSYEKSVFVGPPCTSRDHIAAICKSLIAGDWKSAYGYLTSDKLIKLYKGIMGYKVTLDGLKIIFERKCKEESLRSLLFGFVSCHKVMSIQHLMNVFELGIEEIYSVISKMISLDELKAGINAKSNLLFIRGSTLSSLQQSAINLSENIVYLNEDLEKLVEMEASAFCGWNLKFN